LYPRPWELLQAIPYPETASWIQFQLLVGLAAWPWLTTFTLLIFRQTMRQAKIKPAHVLRCAIYAGSFTTLLAIPLTHVIVRYSAWMLYGRTIFVDYHGMIAVLLLIAVLTYRLSIAYRVYLAFPQSVATCALAQAVVTLALLALFGWHIVF
jgi:hypothetical protein